jgi:predicted short-subunit dehydrogenase-like oxidoreductase (DUF2520 family)
MMNETHGTQHGGLQRNPHGSELKLKPLLLGNGRLAKHLHHYFHLEQIPHKHFENARDLDSPDLHRKLEGVNAIWILTSDRSIAEIKSNLESKIAPLVTQSPDSNYTWIHSSAATEVEGMITLHPLMTFGPELYSHDQYRQIPFAVMGASANSSLQDYLNLPNPSFVVRNDQRALYHAYAVLMSNLPILLWAMTSKNAESTLNLAPETFDPILRQTLSNFITQREKALTGPIARGDRLTIDKNLTALRTQPNTLANIYETFLSSFSYHSEGEKR